MGLTCREVVEKLEREYPPSCAEQWDNVGLLVGRMDAAVKRVYIALDLTEEVLQEAVGWGADLILTHHPVIFQGIKRVNDQDFIGRKILELAENHTACYAMHTNFDVLAMADINERLLGFQDTKVLFRTGEDGQGRPLGIGRVGEVKPPMDLESCARLVKERFGLSGVRVFGDLKRIICRAAVSGGSGKSMIGSALAGGAQVLITGDIDHHTGLDAVDQGLCIIDAGHYGTEYCFVPYMEDRLGRMFPQLELCGAKKRDPFVDI